jgi:hypothetical protein
VFIKPQTLKLGGGVEITINGSFVLLTVPHPHGGPLRHSIHVSEAGEVLSIASSRLTSPTTPDGNDGSAPQMG